MAPLMGRMMSMPLMISSLIVHAARHAGDTEIVSRRGEGDTHRYTWADAEVRSRRLAQALSRLGLRPGDRVGTLAWNGYRHLEAYYGVSGSGLVCHTINPRLFPEQVAWIVTDAQDRALCFDLSFLPLVEKLHEELGSVEHFVLMTERAHMPAHTSIPRLKCYEELIEAENGDYRWPEFDENTASSICYTSGTTGNPKGAIYSHRSTLIHALASVQPDAMGLSACDVALPIVPMFHVNAWGIPYSAALVGCKLVLPGARLDGESLHELFEQERVTFSAGVPTVWLGLLNHLKEQGRTFGSLKRTLIGGSACPPAMMRALQAEHGLEVLHGWGMTELSPLGTVSRLKAKHLELPVDQQRLVLQKQGKVLFGIDMEIVDEDGQPLPWDGHRAGNLVVRGPWVISGYFGCEESPLLPLPGRGDWFPTGDVATIDGDAYMQITDRSKDVIKSGGEWISSIELENVAMSHPGVQEAAAVAARHPKWDERPLLVVVKRPGSTLTRDELIAFYEGRIAKWQVPDDVVFVAELPHTATGKIQKLKLRQQFENHLD